ncbi:hypothetical protein Save01_05394 [Streptomyces avermitilis]
MSQPPAALEAAPAGPAVRAEPPRTYAPPAHRPPRAPAEHVERGLELGEPRLGPPFGVRGAHHEQLHTDEMVVTGELAQRVLGVHPAGDRRHDQTAPAPVLLPADQLLQLPGERVLDAGGVLPHPPGSPLSLATLPAASVRHQLHTARPKRPLGGPLDVEPYLSQVTQFRPQVADGIDQWLQRVRVQRHFTQRGRGLAAQDELRPHHMLTRLVDEGTSPVHRDARAEGSDRQQTFAAGGTLDPVAQRTGPVGAQPDLHRLRTARRPPRHARRGPGELDSAAEDLLQAGVEVPRRHELQRHPLGRGLPRQAAYRRLAHGPDDDGGSHGNVPVGDHPADGVNDAGEHAEYRAGR